MATRFGIRSSRLGALLCSMLLIPGDGIARRDPVEQASEPQDQAPKIPDDQLDSLVAPIALYPDPLLAQVLAASTYPLEIMQLQQWLTKNPGLKDQALQDAVMKQNWDPSIQSMAALPDVVKRLADDIQWTTDLGNAFLAQESDVMNAVQRMRAKAKGSGNLKSNEQMKVETQTVENKQVIVIEQSNPQVVYVPSYNPTVVYGPPAYPYPPIYYPPPGAYAAGMAISFGVGMAMGAAWGGGWCCNSSWGGNNNVVINNNNNFVNNSNRVNNINNRQNVNAGNRTGNSTWKHNPQHRGGTPYSSKASANRFGGTTSGSSMSQRQSNARQNTAQQRTSRQPSGSPSRGGGGVAQSGSMNGAGGRGGGGGGGGGGDRVGNRSVSSGGGGGSRSGAFGGSSGAMSGGGARASSSRGASSMGARGGGGGRRR